MRVVFGINIAKVYRVGVARSILYTGSFHDQRVSSFDVIFSWRANVSPPWRAEFMQVQRLIEHRLSVYIHTSTINFWHVMIYSVECRRSIAFNICFFLSSSSFVLLIAIGSEPNRREEKTKENKMLHRWTWRAALSKCDWWDVTSRFVLFKEVFSQVHKGNYFSHHLTPRMIKVFCSSYSMTRSLLLALAAACLLWRSFNLFYRLPTSLWLISFIDR